MRQAENNTKMANNKPETTGAKFHWVKVFKAGAFE